MKSKNIISKAIVILLFSAFITACGATGRDDAKIACCIADNEIRCPCKEYVQNMDDDKNNCKTCGHQGNKHTCNP